MNSFAERLALAALRRFSPRASDSFARRALGIAAQPLIERELDRLAEGDVATVRGGPFAGLKMLRHSSGTAHLAKILGTYEAQLTPWIDRLVARRPATIVNIGCGDGYYLSGMAMRLPDARAIGFDGSARCQAEAARTASLNGLGDRIAVRGFADAAALAAALTDHAVAIVDCEGGELELLDPVKVPALARTTMLVEMHDYLAPGATAALHARFGASHAIETIGQAVTLPADMAATPEIIQLALVCEHREQAQQWMLLTPR